MLRLARWAHTPVTHWQAMTLAELARWTATALRIEAEDARER